MINQGKHSILGVNVHAVDYEYATARIVEAARRGQPCAVSALAVHGVMTGFQDRAHRRRLNGIDLVVPDGQPVRWALRWIHGVTLRERVYGPTLVLEVLGAAARNRLPVYLYGSTSETLHRLVENLRRAFPDLLIAGAEPSKFRRIAPAEKADVVARIKGSGARIVIAGLGCPRQEVWAYEYRELLSMPILAVGAAFDFHAGTLPQAPSWMQRRGLEWLYRLSREPRRLWRRYFLLNPSFLVGVGLEVLSLWHAPALAPRGDVPEVSFG